MFDIETYDYYLPPHLIAQYPAPERDKSRLLVVERASGHLRDHQFRDLPGLLRPGDLLVVNDTRVVPVRLLAKKDTGGRVELFVLNGIRDNEGPTSSCWCLFRASKRPKRGMRLVVDSSIQAEIVELGRDGFVKVQFEGGCVKEILEKKGHVPLPPYIRRSVEPGDDAVDRDRYQTIFCKTDGAVAAPTAGLHFTERLLRCLRDRDIDVTSLTLHVGYGTFQPVRTKDIREHRLIEEYFIIPEETAEAVAQCKARGGRVVAVGTTVVRAMEGVASRQGGLKAQEGTTDLLITPGFEFRVVDALITNFHLPKSSLLFLVSAFAGLELIRKAYGHAISKSYRFYSYGDAMLVL